LEVLALRLAVSLPVLGALLLTTRAPLGFTRGDLRPLIAGGAIMTAHFLIQIAGLTMTSATNTAWIITVTPLALAVLSFFFLRERLGPGGMTGIAVATVGIVLLVSRGRPADLQWLRSTGDWLALTSAFTWAAYTVVTRDLVRRRHPLAVTSAVLFISSLCIAIPFVMSADVTRLATLSVRGIVAVLYLAIFGLVVGQWFWQVGVAKLGATRAGLYLYLEPLSTLGLAVPMLGEPFTGAMAAGAGLVLVGVFLGQRDRLRSSSA
jgi:drug/metabolite transporter (DMT)-like permease